MASFSIAAPTDQGWSIDQIDENRDTVRLQKDYGRYFMYFGKQTITNDRMKSWTAQQIADTYRAGERRNMEVRGAGTYKLTRLENSQTVVAGKTFYTMDYGKDITEHGLITSESLYLYFPEQSDIDTFYVILYVEASEKHTAAITSYREEFLQTLRSFSLY